MKNLKKMVGVMLSLILVVCIFAVPVSAATTKLSAPANFKASSVTETSSKLAWDKVAKADAYRVFMYDKETDEYEIYKNVSTTSCTVKDLKSGTTYKFKVAALVKSGNKYKIQTKSKKLSVKTSKSTGSVSRDKNETLGQKNAIKSAESYLNFMPFSRKRLIEQLEYEGYSNADATYAVDHIKVNWNEQAAKSAKSYLDFMSFSRQGLIDQLIYEGFTASQAEYGVKSAGY